MKRITKKGQKIRQGRRASQVDKFVGDLKLGANDKRLVKKLLGSVDGSLTTKKAVSRSKRIESLIKTGDIKKLSKFKPFKDIQKTDIKSFESLLKKLREEGFESESAFMTENRELVQDYNELTDRKKGSPRNKVRIEIEQQYSKYRKEKDKLEF